jgi:hypothetical protein
MSKRWKAAMAAFHPFSPQRLLVASGKPFAATCRSIRPQIRLDPGVHHAPPTGRRASARIRSSPLACRCPRRALPTDSDESGFQPLVVMGLFFSSQAVGLGWYKDAPLVLRR